LENNRNKTSCEEYAEQKLKETNKTKQISDFSALALRFEIEQTSERWVWLNQGVVLWVCRKDFNAMHVELPNVSKCWWNLYFGLNVGGHFTSVSISVTLTKQVIQITTSHFQYFET